MRRALDLDPIHRLRLVLAAACLAACSGKSVETQFTTLPPPPANDPVVLRPFEPAPLNLRALLGWQYRNTVRDLLGPAAAAVVNPPPDATVNGFDAIGSAQLALSGRAIDMYESSAQAAASVAMADAATRAFLLGCAPQSDADAGCMTRFVSRFGRKAWRRPLSDEENAGWVAVGMNASAAYGDFYKGAAFVTAGLLQSPNFLYQIEIGEADPANPDRKKLCGYEIATRMAFFLTGSTPDDALITAAEHGELDSAEGVRLWAEELLNQSTSRDAVARFFDELLQLRDLAQLAKDRSAFPMYSSVLASAMREETQRFLDNVIWEENGDFRDVLDADYTFVNRDLALLYGLSDVPSAGFARARLPAESRRGGILGQAAFLSLMAHPATSSPTLRGKFVREKLLCQNIPPPPPNVDTNLPNTAEMTTREKLLAHRQNPSCASCHVLMDDIGLGLENFDAIGRYRETDSGQPVDASTVLDDLGSFTGPRELGVLLRNEQRVTECIARNLFRAATGHVDTLGETAPLNQIYGGFAASGYRFRQLLVEIAVSDAFRFGGQQGGGP